MFINKILKRNPQLIDAAILLHRSGQIEPDTYLVDYDQTIENARLIYEEAKRQGIELYFMLKQLGRNPLIAKALVEMGYLGAVAVDFREAKVMMDNDIPLGNVGHLVQTPKHILKSVMAYGSEVLTVFSIEKLREINEIAEQLGIIQDVIVKVYSEGDQQFHGQEGGIFLHELPEFLDEALTLANINVVGATSFPAFLYDIEAADIKPTHNYTTIMAAIELMKKRGIEIKQINVPSTTSVHTLELIGKNKATHAEPGHGLTGSTPAHAYQDMPEIPSVVYVSEVSHTFKDNSYCYGGGYYRRSCVKNALVSEGNQLKRADVYEMDSTMIDYYFELKGRFDISSTVIMAFRFQIFVTRSHVAVVKGINSGNYEILGIYDNNGKKV